MEARRKEAAKQRITGSTKQTTEFKDYQQYLQSSSDSDSDGEGGNGDDGDSENEEDDNDDEEEAQRLMEEFAARYGGKENIAGASTEDQLVAEIEDLARRGCPKKVINTLVALLCDDKVSPSTCSASTRVLRRYLDCRCHWS